MLIRFIPFNIAVALWLSSCQLGTNQQINSNKLETFVTVSNNSDGCFPAEFLNPGSQLIYPDFGESSFCAPYLNLQTNNAPLAPLDINNIVDYYYGSGATLTNTCPAIAYKSEVNFPESAPYAQDIQQLVTQATNCIQAAMAPQIIRNPLFVFDIDDTLTGGYIASCQYKFGDYQSQIWDTAKESSAFVRTPHMKELLNYAFNNKIAIALVSGRPIVQTEVTIQNLITAYPEFTQQITQVVAEGHLFLIPTDEAAWSIDSFKNVARQNLIQQGYTIILNMGDQYSDLDYTYPFVTPPYCSYKLPNFMYYVS